MSKAPKSQPACPSCTGSRTFDFYHIDRVPVHSCVLLDSEEESLGYPRHRIDLYFCRDCGFIFNAAFQPELVDYTQPYEDQQAFSPTFAAFATALARRLVEKHSLYGKTLIEIGCGKGDFLAELCRLGENWGIGIDPAVRADRIPADVAWRIQCIPEYFSQNHLSLRGDFVCCRHTLEHVPHTLEFVRRIFSLSDHNPPAPVFVEVPDTLRVLKELAFWDIYYEHCSYFTAASLRHLFAKVGFEVLEVKLAYGDQYLLLEAVPGRPGKSLPPEANEVGMLEAAARRFSVEVAEKIQGWREIIRGLVRDGKKLAIWGAGSKAVGFLTTLGLDDEVQALVDINPFRQGRYLPGFGKKILAPEELREYRPDVVIAMNPLYRTEIAGELERLGLTAEVLAV
ncbi:MAG: class I SAM-dependent methyltransferase [candidate division KSB1 bacterium]|nr:class I SAM-dependent methyltransferase [candidate division KSB1 bacterium]